MSTFLSDSSSPEDASFGQEEKEYTGVKKMPVHIDQCCIFFPPLFPSFPLEKLCKNVECIKHQHAHTPFDKKPCYTTFNCVRLYILCAAALKELGTLSPNLRNAPLRKLHTNYFRRIALDGSTRKPVCSTGNPCLAEPDGCAFHRSVSFFSYAHRSLSFPPLPSHESVRMRNKDARRTDIVKRQLKQARCQRRRSSSFNIAITSPSKIAKCTQAVCQGIRIRIFAF